MARCGESNSAAKIGHARHWRARQVRTKPENDEESSDSRKGKKQRRELRHSHHEIFKIDANKITI